MLVMARKMSANKRSFIISCFDLVVEIFYKYVTNQRSLIAQGWSYVNRLSYLIISFFAYIQNKINSYYNQYFQPASSGERNQLRNCVPNLYMYGFLTYLYLPGLVILKLSVDYKHLSTTIIGFILTLTTSNFWLLLGLHAYIATQLLESGITSFVEWKTSLGCKDENEKRNWHWYKKWFDYITQRLTVINSLFEGFILACMIIYDATYSLLYKCILTPLLLCSSLTSATIKRAVFNKNTNEAKEDVKRPSLIKQALVLFMYIIMILSPLVQYVVTVDNIKSFFGIGASWWLIHPVSMFIVATFMIHKYTYKGDQVYKFLYGKSYVEKGYEVLGLYRRPPERLSDMNFGSFSNEYQSSIMREKRKVQYKENDDDRSYEDTLMGGF